MTSRQPNSPRAPSTADGTPFAIGATLGTALASSIIVLVGTGALWPLIAVIVLGGVLALWATRRDSPTDHGGEQGLASIRPGPRFMDWNTEGLMGGFSDTASPTVAPAGGAATLAAKSTIVDTQA